MGECNRVVLLLCVYVCACMIVYVCMCMCMCMYYVCVYVCVCVRVCGSNKIRERKKLVQINESSCHDTGVVEGEPDGVAARLR